MSTSFHINFDGRCKEAFEYYEEHLGGKIGSMLAFSASPASSSVPDDRQNQILHANIRIDGVELAGGDLESTQYEKPQGFHVLLSVDTENRVRSVFAALKVDGEVILTPQKTFWSQCYGIVIDRFGVPWKINCGD